MSAEIIPARTPAEVFLASLFERSKATLPGNAKVAKWREDTFQRFYAAGLPHRRIEAWHYTDLRTLIRDALPVATPPDETAIAALRETFAADAPAPRLVLVDGFFVPELSTPMPDGIKITSLASVLSEGRPDTDRAVVFAISRRRGSYCLIERGSDAGRRHHRSGGWNADRRAASSYPCEIFSPARRAFLPLGLASRGWCRDSPR